jgi:hypothetical protein
VFHVRRILDFCILFRRNSGFNGLMAEVLQPFSLFVNVFFTCSHACGERIIFVLI